MIVFLIIALVGGIVFYALIVAKAPKKSGSSHGRSPRGGYRAETNISLSDVRSRWTVIQATAEGGAAGLKSAITEADKLVDSVMRAKGVGGETMGERLKAAKPRFSDYAVYDGLWRAHKMRNSLAHDIGFDLVPSQAREALRDFERGLHDLGAL